MTAPLGRMLVAQTRAELRTRWRIPAFSLTSLVLPIVFYTFFGLPVAHHGFGIGVAAQRGMTVDLLVRVTPLPSALYLLAKIVTAPVFVVFGVSPTVSR